MHLGAFGNCRGRQRYRDGAGDVAEHGKQSGTVVIEFARQGQKCDGVDRNKQEAEAGALNRPRHHQGAEVDIRRDDDATEYEPEPQDQKAESDHIPRLHDLHQGSHNGDQHHECNPAWR